MGKRTKEFYISIDVETDGPVLGRNSMLQFGAAFYKLDGSVSEKLLFNMLEIEGGVQDPETMAWWKEQEIKFPGIWDRMMQNRVDPSFAMLRFKTSVERVARETNASPLCVAYPAGYDFTWLIYYMGRFLGKSCVGFSCLDMKTLAMTLIQDTYHNSAKKRFPAEWFDPTLKHTHNALDDALEQGHIFLAMKKDMEGSWSVLDTQKRALQGRVD